jgi:hypothetical protein
MNNTLNEQCPFGLYDTSIDLSNRILNEDEKRWLGMELKDRKETLISMELKYNLNIKTLSKYQLRTTRGFRLYKVKGRPAALDETSSTIVQENLASDPFMAEDALRELIRYEYAQSTCRKFTKLDANELKAKSKLSRRSVVRYSLLFRNVHANVPDMNMITLGNL